jgi:hypothetical protein
VLGIAAAASGTGLVPFNRSAPPTEDTHGSTISSDAP